MSCNIGKICFSVTLTVITFAAPVFADDAPSPDKSDYTLFNPVPDDEMRSFSTDRPAKSNSATTVDAGHFQYETDIANWMYDRYSAAGQTTSHLVLVDPVLKAGLTNDIDFELAITPINIDHVTDRTTSTYSDDFGFGDIVLRTKFNLFGNEGGTYALALVPYVKAPTAPLSIGNGHWEGGGYAPFSITLSDTWSVTLQTELDILENTDLTGVHPNYQNLINVQHNFTDTFAVQTELWSDVNAGKDSPTQYTFDVAGLWGVAKDLQLDIGTNIGLNKAAPDIQVYTGISQRF